MTVPAVVSPSRRQDNLPEPDDTAYCRRRCL